MKESDNKQLDQTSTEQGRAYEQVSGDYFPNACGFCGGMIFVPKGHSYGACQDCGAV